MISVSCERRRERERSGWWQAYCWSGTVRRVEWDDVIQLLEKLDSLEADDAIWQILEDVIYAE